MATEKWIARLEAKLDALLEKSGIDMAQFGENAEKQAASAPRELTAQEQDAINNAPKAEATIPPQEKGPRVTQANAPDTSGSTPPDSRAATGSTPRVPSDAVGSVTVETKEADGDVSVDTMPASDAKGKK